jgi:hypothetical protein
MKDAGEAWLLIAGAIGVAITAMVKTWRNLRRLSRMVDEFLGYEDDAGRHVPGLGERVTVLEEELADVKRLLAIALASQGVDPETI